MTRQLRKLLTAGMLMLAGSLLFIQCTTKSKQTEKIRFSGGTLKKPIPGEKIIYG